MKKNPLIDRVFEAMKEIEFLKGQLRCANDVIGCLQVENDDYRERLSKFEDVKE